MIFHDYVIDNWKKCPKSTFSFFNFSDIFWIEMKEYQILRLSVKKVLKNLMSFSRYIKLNFLKCWDFGHFWKTNFIILIFSTSYRLHRDMKFYIGLKQSHWQLITSKSRENLQNLKISEFWYFDISRKRHEIFQNFFHRKS